MKILSIQSAVAYGHVGNSAAVFPLQRIGVEVLPVYTVNFSNHTGYGAWRGPLIPPADVAEVIRGIEERGVFPEGIGEVILDAVARVKAANPSAVYACDPVMGNAASGCFVAPAIPVLLRERVVPHADLEREAIAMARTILTKSPTAIRMLKFAFNAVDDGMVGQQVFAGEATRLAYGTDEAVEGRDAFLEKRAPDWSPYPWHY